jgi:cysteine desulfurase
LPVDQSGLAGPEAVADALRPGPAGQALASVMPGRVELNGPAGCRLPTTLNISIAGLRGQELLAATPGVAASTGSACHSGQHSPSPVLVAMGLDEARALAAIRLSVGRWTTRADIDAAAGELAGAAIRLS